MTTTPNRWVAGSATYVPDRYFTSGQIAEMFAAWADAFPTIFSFESIGTTREGRNILAATLTNRETGAPEDKPATFVDANIHAGEVTGCATVLWLLNTMLTGYGHDERITRLLDGGTLYAVPAIMLDGMDLYLTTPERLRSSVRPYPFIEPQPGLRRADLNGDGLILQMRQRDDAGAWKPHPDDPRVMIPRQPDEVGGEYYSLYEEGEIREWDGGAVRNAPEHYGLDLNRAFPARWSPEAKQRGAGDLPLEEPEPRTLAEFLVSHPNICTTQHFHTWSAVILRPSPEYSDRDMPPFDLRMFTAIGKLGEEETGYRCVSIYDDYAYDKKTPITGGLLDWLYESLGIYAFSTELWSLPRKAGIEITDWMSWMQHHPDADDLAMARALDEHVDGAGLYAWQPFEHPQLGPVEIGGWDYKFTIQNPPGPLLKDVTAGNATFVLREMGTNPKLELQEPTAERLADGLWKVSVVARNTGFLPTWLSEKGKANPAIRGLRITLAGAEPVAGTAAQDLGHLEGRANLYGSVKIPSRYDNLSAAKAEWIVRAPAGASLEIVATCTKGGTVRRRLTLEPENQESL